MLQVQRQKRKEKRVWDQFEKNVLFVKNRLGDEGVQGDQN
jgi:hypothetical protein